MKKDLFKFVTMILITLSLNLTSLSNAAELKNIKLSQNTHSGFIAKQNNKTILTIGKYEDRHAPFSTFKVALALMGFDARILENKDSPKWAFKEEYEKNFQSWYTREKGLEYHWCQKHTPATFMKNSVVWFSHQITERLGEKKFQEYVSKLDYGNKDVSGTVGKDGMYKNDGLLNSWLGTSLQISPLEQVEFLEKLVANELALSTQAQEKTREIMDKEEDWNGWKLYGKTGGGSGKNGWFIGWIEKDGQRIIFAQYLDLTDTNLDFTGIPTHKSVGLTAKEVIKKQMLNFLYR
jgi:beta-lactamase class D